MAKTGNKSIRQEGGNKLLYKPLNIHLDVKSLLADSVCSDPTNAAPGIQAIGLRSCCFIYVVNSAPIA